MNEYTTIMDAFKHCEKKTVADIASIIKYTKGIDGASFLDQKLHDRFACGMLKFVNGYSALLYKDGMESVYSNETVIEVLEAIFGVTVLSALYALQTNRKRRMLIIGETGVGKEKISQLIAHTLIALQIQEPEEEGQNPEPEENGKRTTKNGQITTVNASAFTESLTASELFGIGERVASGVKGREGAFAMANEGCLIMDEIHQASLSMQGQLLRVIENGSFQKVGETTTKNSSFHFIGISNIEPDQLKSGTNGFRQDLFHRIGCPVIKIPPIRDRWIKNELDVRRILSKAMLNHTAENNYGAGWPGTCDNIGLWIATAQAVLVRIESKWDGNLREMRTISEELLNAASANNSEKMERIRKQAYRQTGEPASIQAQVADIFSWPLRHPLKKCLEMAEEIVIKHASREGATQDEVAALLKMSRSTAARKMKTKTRDEPITPHDRK